MAAPVAAAAYEPVHSDGGGAAERDSERSRAEHKRAESEARNCIALHTHTAHTFVGSLAGIANQIVLRYNLVFSFLE